jgi:hypothetical protein
MLKNVPTGKFLLLTQYVGAALNVVKTLFNAPLVMLFFHLIKMLNKMLLTWARIFKRWWSPGIDSKEWIPPAYVAWRAGTITLFLLGS